MQKQIVRAGLQLLICLLMFAAVGTASAQLKANSVFYAWDAAKDEYLNSQVTIYWDGSWVPFLHELGFDREVVYPPACDVNGDGTTWAGTMDFGLYHTDNAPAGAKGFLHTADWKLVDCDRNGDGSFTAADRTSTSGGYTELLSLSPTSQDVVSACSTGNCAEEIVTTLDINLDTDCDGNKDATLPEFVCFYAEAQVPDMTYTPMWSGPLQARITAGGGDKTVSFSPEEPTALTLLRFGPEKAHDSWILLLAGFVLLFTIVVLVGTGTIWKLVSKEKSTMS
jgi:hypothetical protein